MGFNRPDIVKYIGLISEDGFGKHVFVILIFRLFPNSAPHNNRTSNNKRMWFHIAHHNPFPSRQKQTMQSQLHVHSCPAQPSQTPAHQVTGDWFKPNSITAMHPSWSVPPNHNRLINSMHWNASPYRSLLSVKVSCVPYTVNWILDFFCRTLWTVIKTFLLLGMGSFTFFQRSH